MTRVAVIGHVREEAISLLRARPEIRIDAAPDGPADGFRDIVATADAILLRTSRLDRELIATAPALKVVSRHGVGFDNVDVAALNERRIPLCVAATANNISVAEHAIFMMLELAKAGRAHDAAVRDKRWSIRLENRAIELFGARLLIVGLGRIGKAVASRAAAFGMNVTAIDPYIDDAVFAGAGCARVTDLAAALAGADFVSLHVPLDYTTRNMIDRNALASMKSGAILVNTARGGLIDEKALAEALTTGGIRAAGLDVFEAEPPPASHPLFGQDNVLLSPHSAGVTEQSMLRMGTEAAQNILDVLDGRPDPSVIVNGL